MKQGLFSKKGRNKFNRLYRAAASRSLMEENNRRIYTKIVNRRLTKNPKAKFRKDWLPNWDSSKIP